MKKIFYILIFLFALPIYSLAQNDATLNNDNTYKNQLDLDFYYLGMEVSYKRRIADKLFIGTGIRGLMFRPAINLDLGIEEEFTDLITFRPFLDFQISNNFHIETGLPFSFTYRGDDTYGSSLGAYHSNR